MIEWVATGFLLVWIWTQAVGLPQTIQACAWVIVRKAFPRHPRLAKAIMPRVRNLEVRIPGHPHIFYARWPASDLHILHTIVRREEYAPMMRSLNSAGEILFLDLGANIGAASRYFLDCCPGSRVIAVEPDAGNIKLCRMNLEPYGARARVVHAAVWSRNTRLIFEPETTQPGTEAGVRLREPDSGEGGADSIEGVDVPTLLSQASLTTKDAQIAVKIDIEGSEEALFSGPNLGWLDEVRCIAIELHDKARKNCSRNFFSAVEGHLREPTRRMGETVFAALHGSPGAIEARPGAAGSGDPPMRSRQPH
jgi:FkbM family methyltransferase